MFCKYCGNEVKDEAIICPKCGCQIKDIKEDKSEKSVSVLKTIAKIFMIISCVFAGIMIVGFFGCVAGNATTQIRISIFIYAIPFSWNLPMTISLSNKIKNKEKISIGFKICTLFFVNTISGILLLCDKEEE